MSNSYRYQLFAGGLVMYMQPVVDLHSGRVPKVEALVRLHMPDGHVIAPDRFLPLLEDADLDHVFRLGMDQALRWIKNWDDQGLALEISVNLPPSAAGHPSCPSWVAEALQRYHIAPSRLFLEILESQSLDHARQQENITQLAQMGVRLAMDDLGSGYSSLHRLYELPFDVIKVDQGLVVHLRQSPGKTLVLIKTLIQMGLDLDREVVFEGLGDKGMVEAVTILGARYGQGYGLASPMPADMLPAWIKQFQLNNMFGQVHTFLGALAYHWQSIHMSGSRHPTSVERCPLTEFFLEHGLQNSDGMRWHADIHAGKNMRLASQNLIDWLILKMQEDKLH